MYCWGGDGCVVYDVVGGLWVGCVGWVVGMVDVMVVGGVGFVFGVVLGFVGGCVCDVVGGVDGGVDWFGCVFDVDVGVGGDWVFDNMGCGIVCSCDCVCKVMEFL